MSVEERAGVCQIQTGRLRFVRPADLSMLTDLMLNEEAGSDPSRVFAKRALLEDVFALLVFLTALERLDVRPAD